MRRLVALYDMLTANGGTHAVREQQPTAAASTSPAALRKALDI
jgi:hypothetical protein